MPKRSAHQSLARSHPRLAAEILLFRTPDLSIQEVHAGTHRVVHWRCGQCGHEWEAPVRERARGHKACKRCQSLARRYPEVAAEWHPSQNAPVTPHDVAPNSTDKRWWQCQSCGFEWRASPNQRVQSGPLCKRCKKARVAETLRLTPAEVRRQFRALNLKVRADAYRNNRTPVPVHFLGCGHEGATSLDKAQASARRGSIHGLCQHCSRTAAIARRIAPQEDAERRFRAHDLRLLEAFKGVRQKHHVLHTACGQKGWVRLYTLEAGHPMRCTACLSVARRAPHLVGEWHEDNPQKPMEVAIGSRLQVLWRFSGCGHVEQLSVKDRALNGQGCPVCAGKRVREDNCLLTVRPAIAAEWHPTRNSPLTPRDVTWSSGKRVWWRCVVNTEHSWLAKVNARTSSGTGCPDCHLGRQSEYEVRLAMELKEFFSFDYADRRVSVPGRRRPEEVDIKIPAQRLIVEYDGAYYHKRRRVRDRTKTSRLEAAGWTVIRIREHPLAPLDRTRDVLPPSHAEVKQTMDLLLGRIQEVLGISLPGAARYLSGSTLRRTPEADTYLLSLRRRLNGQRRPSALSRTT